MGRLTMAGALLSVALGSTLVFPVVAQAATAGSAAGTVRITVSSSHQAAVPNMYPGAAWEFWGNVYPDTSAGYSACAQEGEYLVAGAPEWDLGWECRLNSPDAGYDLWILYRSPGYP